MIKRLSRSRESWVHSRSFIAVGSALFFGILSVALFIVYQDAEIIHEQINDEFNHQQLELVRQVAARIELNLGDVGRELERLAWFAERASGREDIDRATEQALQRFSPVGLETVSFADVDPGCSAVDQPHVMLGSLEVVQDVAVGPRIIGKICKRLNLRGGKQQVLEARVNVTQMLAAVVSDVRPGKTGYAWIIDQDAMLLYHPDSELIGRSAFTAPKERAPEVSVEELDRILETSMTRGEAGTDRYVLGWHRDQKGEIIKLVAFAPITSTMLADQGVWSVALTTPVHEVAEAVQQVETRHIFAEIAIIAGMFLFGLFAILHQVRMSRMLEEKVSEKEKFLSSVLTNSVDAIIFIDNENRVQVWNRGAELIFGYTSEEMLGQSFHRLIPSDVDAEEELNRIRQEVRRAGFIRNYRAQRVTKDGKRISIDLSRTMLYSEDNRPIGSTAIIKDVTEKEEMDKLIYNTEKLASIGTLAAGVAHEINNPLTVILGLTDLLRERYAPDTTEHKDLGIIEENANNAKRIVEDMLGFARITEGLEDRVDVERSLRRVLDIVEMTLRQDNVQVVSDISENLPLVRGDAREFQQVVFNLMNNAMAAMTDSGGTLTVEARSEVDHVMVTVSDTGNGIPDRIKAQIFDPFFTTKRVGEGTGLGLSLCYGIVKKYGGTIEFSSVAKEDHAGEPSGTSFTVSMPVYRPLEA